MAGYTIFGHRVAGFASLGSSVRTTGFVVMGDVDWEEMEHVGRFYAYAWLSTFFIIIVLIMLNMLLAIIFETYSEVRTSIGGNAETLVPRFLRKNTVFCTVTPTLLVLRSLFSTFFARRGGPSLPARSESGSPRYENGTIHVSTTVISVSTASTRNHRSQRQRHFCSKDMYRTVISKT